MDHESAQFFPKTALPGSMHAEYVRCSKPACRCASGDLHGPYFRRFWREGGRTHKQYIRLADLPMVQEAVERYHYLHPSRRAFQRMLRDFSVLSDLVIAALEGKEHAHGAPHPTRRSRHG